MKKIYSLMLALAVAALGANAAVPATALKTVAQAAVTTKSLNLKKVETTAAPTALKHKSLAKAANEVTLPEDLTGTYLLANDLFLANPEIVKGTEENSYTIKKFLFSDANDLPGTVAIEDIQVSDTQSVRMPVLTIKGGGAVTFFTIDGADYNLYLAGYDNSGQLGFYLNDLKFAILENNLIFLGDGFAWLNVNTEGTIQGGSWIESVALFMPNGNMTGTEYTDNTTTKQMDYPIYGEMFVDDNEIEIYGFGGFGCLPVVYKMDGANATANRQSPYTLSISQAQADELANQGVTVEPGNYPVTLVDAQANPTVEMSYEVDQENWCVLSTTQTSFAFLNSTLGWYSKFGQMDIEFKLSESAIAGVKDITTAPAEADADAPVEYFNLQGVRVAEPAAGLYIRRQGNNVSKVVIR